MLAPLPREILGAATLIINEVHAINRVVYDTPRARSSGSDLLNWTIS